MLIYLCIEILNKYDSTHDTPQNEIIVHVLHKCCYNAVLAFLVVVTYHISSSFISSKSLILNCLYVHYHFPSCTYPYLFSRTCTYPYLHALIRTCTYLYLPSRTYTYVQLFLGMTTGSLPTFVDISTNFGSSALFEDNFIDILREKQKK